MTDSPTPTPAPRSRDDAAPLTQIGRSAEELLPLVYDQLRAVAAHRMRAERSDHTLAPTALVHEAYVKLSGDREVPWQNRQHFFVAAAEAMRQILLDHARGKSRLKRGGDRSRIPLNLVDVAEHWNLEETLQLDEALSRLQMERPAVADVVRLRFFAGLEIGETGEALGISASTVKRHWEFGRAWLFRTLGESAGEGRE